MSLPTVQHILDEIDELSESDRELLHLRLAERAEAEWRQEADQARRDTRTRGIGQAEIDEAIRKHRYGA